MTTAARLVTALGPDAPDDGEQGRQQRGLAIAALVPITEHKHGYAVPSQSGRGDYIVSLDDDSRYCTCPDFATRRLDCKHLVAATIAALRKATHAVNADTEIEQDDGGVGGEAGDASESVAVGKRARKAKGNKKTKKVEKAVREPVKPRKRPTYQRDWLKYDMAQEYQEEFFEVLLNQLAGLVYQPEYTHGRPRLPLSDMVYAVCRMAYTDTPRRKVMAPLRRAQEKGLITQVPSHASLSRYMERPELTGILKHLIQQSAVPLAKVETKFAVDATGFGTSVYHRWYDKWRKTIKRAQWVKSHGVYGIVTKIVPWVEVTEGNVHESPQLLDLVEHTQEYFTVEEVYADLGYLSDDNYEGADRLKFDLYTPYKINSVPVSPDHRKGGPWERSYWFFNLYREDFLRRYHGRSISETGIHMTKSNHGGSVSGKTQTAQFNEVLAKTLAHNICCLLTAMYEFDLDLSFGTGESKLALPDAYYRRRKEGQEGSIYGRIKSEPRPEPAPLSRLVRAAA